MTNPSESPTPSEEDTATVPGAVTRTAAPTPVPRIADPVGLTPIVTEPTVEETQPTMDVGPSVDAPEHAPVPTWVIWAGVGALLVLGVLALMLW